VLLHQNSWAVLGQLLGARAAFDQQWLMNPSKVFPLEGRPAA
jgi:glycolate oxidase